MRLSLISDFRDYYDPFFDSAADDSLRRVTTDGLSRPDMLEFLSSHGCTVPPHGLVRAARRRTDKADAGEWQLSGRDAEERLVVYTDIHAHRGEGKALISFEEAKTNHGGEYAIEYIPRPEGVSWRYLQLGLIRVWIEYRNDGWRSNYGDNAECKVFAREADGLHATIALPLFAIDFIPGEKLWAVDFNIAPGIRGTGVEDIVSNHAAADSIRNAYSELLSKGIAL